VKGDVKGYSNSNAKGHAIGDSLAEERGIIGKNCPHFLFDRSSLKFNRRGSGDGPALVPTG